MRVDKSCEGCIYCEYSDYDDYGNYNPGFYCDSPECPVEKESPDFKEEGSQ